MLNEQSAFVIAVAFIYRTIGLHLPSNPRQYAAVQIPVHIPEDALDMVLQGAATVFWTKTNS